MKQSVEVTEEQISDALRMLGTNLRGWLLQKGRHSFVNAAEILGTTQLEVRQLEQAVQIKEPQRIIEELLDVAVGCVLGVASMKAHSPSEIPSRRKQ